MSEASLSPSVLAGLLLDARAHLRALGLPHPEVGEILEATSACRSQAFARRAAVRSAVQTLNRPRGRPARDRADSDEAQVARIALAYVAAHPGCVVHRGQRRFYSSGYRAAISALRQRWRHLPLSSFARAVQVRPSTLRAWLRRDEGDGGERRVCGRDLEHEPGPRPSRARVTRERTPAAELIDAWRSWSGSFSGFCAYTRTVLGLPWRRTAIARRLADAGLRVPETRAGRAAEDDAVRGAFRSFFPGAIWSSDGARVVVRVDGEAYAFNLQLAVDTDSGALLGVSIRDHEDGSAVREAFFDAVRTAGAPPLGLLLDQRPCNHGETVQALQRHTEVIYAGRNRPQSKGHVEGAFGLFAQSAPPLELWLERGSGRDGEAAEAGEGGVDRRTLARQTASLVVQTWARSWNYRPRRTRGRNHRVALYRGASVSAQAQHEAGVEIARRARRGPGRRCRTRQLGLQSFVRAELARLGIADAAGYTARALATRPSHAVIDALAMFDGKRAAATLPADAGGAYLLGIVERLCREREGLALGDALWRVRSDARAHVAATLDDMFAHAWAAGGEGDASGHAIDHAVGHAIDHAIDHASDSEGKVDRQLWLVVVARLIARAPGHLRREHYRRACRRILACARWSARTQREAMRSVAAELLPLSA
ncbi:transposase [Haliangium ochraceum]|uniref:transposase n=1 Tax=Haliangium ochraceum TaxID=80816 RepID=UPI00019BA68C|nr:transposase [Haliangium ochraceum]